MKKTTEQATRKPTTLLATIGTMVAFCCGGMMLVSLVGQVISPKSSAPAATPVISMQLPTGMPAMAATSETVVDVQTPPPAPPPARGGETGAPAVSAPGVGGGVIPGLEPADVTVNLRDKGFDCEAAEPSKSGHYYIWRCKNSEPTLGIDMMVEAWGRSLQSVDSIDATIINPMGDDAAVTPVLGFIATMPYDGAQPAQARQWVEDTIGTITGDGDVKEKVIAGVQFQLFGPPTARNLEIGSMESAGASSSAAAATSAPATSAPAVVAKSGRVQVAGGNPSVNIRAEPSTEAAKVGQLVAGEVAEQVGALADGSWVQVRVNGVEGWIRADLVEPAAEAGAAVVPAVETPAVVDVATSAPAASLVRDSRDPGYSWNWGAGTQAGTSCICGGPDLSCGDFDSWQASQACFDKCGGSASNNVFGLDRNHNGVVCEKPK